MVRARDPQTVAEYIGYGLVWNASCADALFTKAVDVNLLREANTNIMGRNGSFTKLLTLLKDVPAIDRPKVGNKINHLSRIIRQKFNDRLFEITGKENIDE